MEFPNQLKDIVYRLLQEPTLDNLRDFLRGETGEHNAIDFKREWIAEDKLAKLMLALANYGGGFVVFGVHENPEKTFSCDGLTELKPKEDVANKVKKYISPYLRYDIYDFVYQDSEYAQLKDKKFQMLVIEDTPEHLPFISRRQSTDIKASMIYIRRGNSDELVTEEELTRILERRAKYLYPETGQSLKLEDHLDQLKILYKDIQPKITKQVRPSGLISSLRGLKTVTELLAGTYESIDNPYYPEISYDEFIAGLIAKKKKKIERVLDLK